MAELWNRPWVAMPPGTASRAALQSAAANAGEEPQVLDVCVEFPTLLSLVEAGRGAALVPHLALPARGGWRRVPGAFGGRTIPALSMAVDAQEPGVRATVAALDEVAEALRAAA